MELAITFKTSTSSIWQKFAANTGKARHIPIPSLILSNFSSLKFIFLEEYSPECSEWSYN